MYSSKKLYSGAEFAFWHPDHSYLMAPGWLQLPGFGRSVYYMLNRQGAEWARELREDPVPLLV